MKQWVCSKCSSRNRENMKFCHVCHIPRPAETVPQDRSGLPPAQPVYHAEGVHRFTVPALRRSRGFAVMTLLVLLNIAVLFASLVGLIVLKGG